MRPALRWSLLALALPACALLGKSEPRVPHYFTPEYQGEVASPATTPGPRLRLGRVEAWSHLRERLVRRGAARELFYAEDRRWTERPEVYLREALARTLFEERGLVEVLSGPALTLDVELSAFEALEVPQVVRLAATLRLRDERVSRRVETVVVEVPIGPAVGGDPAAAVVEAHGLALRAAVLRMADLVEAGLAEVPAAGAPGAFGGSR